MNVISYEFKNIIIHFFSKRRMIRWLPSYNRDLKHFYWLKFEIILLWN